MRKRPSKFLVAAAVTHTPSKRPSRHPVAAIEFVPPPSQVSCRPQGSGRSRSCGESTVATNDSRVSRAAPERHVKVSGHACSAALSNGKLYLGTNQSLPPVVLSPALLLRRLRRGCSCRQLDVGWPRPLLGCNSSQREGFIIHPPRTPNAILSARSVSAPKYPVLSTVSPGPWRQARGLLRDCREVSSHAPSLWMSGQCRPVEFSDLTRTRFGVRLATGTVCNLRSRQQICSNNCNPPP